jgi:hypothetical protein
MHTLGYRYLGPCLTPAEVAAAVAEEREACAKIADTGMLVPPDGGSPTEGEVEGRSASPPRSARGEAAMSDRATKIGRLALRHEGESWNAYYAAPDTMQDAIWLGSLHIKLALRPANKTAFMALMRDCVADIIEEQTGRRPRWNEPVAAPEHEKGSRA